ncbi:MAG: CvpA family protein [Treponema sp.]|nr:CvpA family protein [Treponema sp.]
MNIAIVDFVFAGIIILFVLRCVLRGFVSEIVSLAAVAFGFLSAILFFRGVGGMIRERFMPGIATVPEIIAFVGLFLVVFVIAKLLEALLKSIIDGFGLDWLDRVLGALLGLAEGVVIVCLLLFLITIQPLFYADAVLGNSLFADILLPFILGRNWELPAIIVLNTGGAIHV